MMSESSELKAEETLAKSEFTVNSVESQSLPVNVMMKCENTSELSKKELSSPDLFKLNIVEGDMVNVNLKENKRDESVLVSKSPVDEAKTKAKSSVFSIFEKMFFKSTNENNTNINNENNNIEVNIKETLTVQTVSSQNSNNNNSEKLNVSNSSAVASASSPNPDCSPYKLLDTYSKHPTDLISNNDKIVENLTEVEKIESHNEESLMDSNNLNLTENNGTAITTSSSTNTNTVHQIPASSREFCMGLNFNLAAAAAATASAPVVVVDNSKSPSNQQQQQPKQSVDNNNRFTSNASTSSIHNDLKAILEESKIKKSPESSSSLSTSTSSSVLLSSPESLNNQAPKPQRVKHSEQNKQLTPPSPQSIHQLSPQQKQQQNQQKQQKQQKQQPQQLEQLETKTETRKEENLKSPELKEASENNAPNLIKTMLTMIENNKSKEASQAATFSDWSKQNLQQDGRYRYSREFLTQIREQRADFIDQIYPDIFKAYCYCMNGKYWDPEKYFDIGQYDKIANRQKYNNRNNHHSQHQNHYQPQQPQRRKHNMRSNNNAPNTIHAQLDSPQPLQVPKNSPKLDLNKENLDADKILLGLIKKESPEAAKETNVNTGLNLLDMLNKKPKQQPQQQSANILSTLFQQTPANTNTKAMVSKQASSPTPRHFPLILTAQELEMSQINEQNKTKLPMELNVNEDKNSDAYKQLVKNLSTQPVNSPTTSTVKKAADDIMSKLHQHKKQTNETNDATKVLRQLLNLNNKPAEEVENSTSKKNNTKSKKHHHNFNQHHKNKSTSSTSSFNSSQSDNNLVHAPKPFESNDQIEKLVANAFLNHQQRQQQQNPLKSFIDKINQNQKMVEQKNEQEHFNLLMNKIHIAPQQQQQQLQHQLQVQQETKSNDILKWFTTNNPQNSVKLQMPGGTTLSPTTLSEIELIENHQRPSQFNNFF